MEEISDRPYARRYPALSIESECQAILAIRIAREFGQRYMIRPDGSIRERDGMTAHRCWEIRRRIAKEWPLPPEYRHRDEWIDEPEPTPDDMPAANLLTASVAAPTKPRSWLRRLLSRLFS